MKTRSNHLTQIVLMYIIMGLSGLLSWKYMPIEEEVFQFFAAHIVMTIICFLFSLLKNNSSVYDAFWSVIPFFFCVMWAIIHSETLNIFHILTLGTVSLWSWRLTMNWARSWDGFGHEDWRYIDLANKSGKMYPFVNFLGIHLFPTIMVFASMLPLFYIFLDINPNKILFALGIFIALSGIGFEHFADNELFRFRKRPNPKQEEILQTGLWGMCRYPNYLGESLFWIGLAVIGQAHQAPWYTVIGSVAMFLMIRFISIPMKEERMLARRPSFEAYQAKTPLLLPKLFKK